MINATENSENNMVDKKTEEDLLECSEKTTDNDPQDLRSLDECLPPSMLTDDSDSNMDGECDKENDAPDKKRSRSISRGGDDANNISTPTSPSRRSHSESRDSPQKAQKAKKSSKKKQGPIELEDMQNDGFLNFIMDQNKKSNFTLFPELHESKEQKLLAVKQELQTIMKTASQEFISKVYRSAEENYHKAIEMLCRFPYQELGLREADVMVLKYSLCVACIHTESYTDIVKGIDLLKEIEELYIVKLPAIYFGLAKGFCTLNRFKISLEYVSSGLSFLERGVRFSTYPWPGTKELIFETTRDGLEKSLKELEEICRVPHKPDAVCRYLKCLSLSTHIAPTDVIYFNDPGFSGYYVIICESKCRIEYHIYCWKDFKESRSTSIDKPKDRDILGQECPTTDCVTKNNVRSAIIKIEIYGEAAIMKTCLEISSEQAVHESKKSRKKKTDRHSESEKTKQQHHPRPKQPREERPREERPREERPREERPLPPSLPPPPPKESKEKPKVAPQIEQVPDNSEEEFEEKLKKLEHLRKNNFYFCRDFMSDLEQPYEDETDDSGAGDQSSVIKEFIISYFYEYIRAEGSKKEREIKEKWSQDSTEFDSWKQFIEEKDVCDFLVSSSKFVKIDDNICITEIARSTYELAETELRESVSFIMRDHSAMSNCTEEETVSEKKTESNVNNEVPPEDDDVESCTNKSEIYKTDDEDEYEEDEESDQGDKDIENEVSDVEEDKDSVHIQSDLEDELDKCEEDVNKAEQDQIENKTNENSDGQESRSRRESLNPDVEEFCPRKNIAQELQNPEQRSEMEERTQNISADNNEVVVDGVSCSDDKLPELTDIDDIYHSDDDITARILHPPVVVKETKDNFAQTDTAKLPQTDTAKFEKKVIELTKQNALLKLNCEGMERLKTETATLKNENSSLRSENTTLKAKIAKLEKEIKKVHDDIKSCRNEKDSAIKQMEITTQVLEKRIKVMEDTNKQLREEKKQDIDAYKKASQISLEKAKQEHREERRLLQLELREAKEKTLVAETNLKEFKEKYAKLLQSLAEERCDNNLVLESGKANIYLEKCAERLREFKALETILQNYRDPAVGNIVIWVKEWENAKINGAESLKELQAKYAQIKERLAQGDEVEAYPKFNLKLPIQKFSSVDIIESVYRKCASYMNPSMFRQTQAQQGFMVPPQSPSLKNNLTDYPQHPYMNSPMPPPSYMKPPPTSQQMPFGPFSNFYMPSSQHNSVPPFSPLYGQISMPNTIPSTTHKPVTVGITMPPSVPKSPLLSEVSDKLTSDNVTKETDEKKEERQQQSVIPSLLDIQVTTSSTTVEPFSKAPGTRPVKPPVPTSTVTQVQPPISSPVVTMSAAPPASVIVNGEIPSRSSTPSSTSDHVTRPSPAALEQVTRAPSTLSEQVTRAPSTLSEQVTRAPSTVSDQVTRVFSTASEHVTRTAPTASKASTRSTTPSSLELSNKPKAEGKPSQGKNLSKLVAELQKRFPLKSCEELVRCVMAIREKNNNSLSGLPMISIINNVEKMLLEQAKKKEGSMGLEKFGSSAWAIDTSPQVTWNKPTDSDEESCSICLEMLDNNQTMLHCKHSFHSECIRRWLTSESICPICREYTRLDDEFPPLRLP